MFKPVEISFTAHIIQDQYHKPRIKQGQEEKTPSIQNLQLTIKMLLTKLDSLMSASKVLICLNSDLEDSAADNFHIPSHFSFYKPPTISMSLPCQ